MTNTIRLGGFLLLSISIHWLAAQIDFSQQAALSTTDKHGVSFVSRSAEQFLTSPVIQQPIEEVSSIGNQGESRQKAKASVDIPAKMKPLVEAKPAIKEPVRFKPSVKRASTVRATLKVQEVAQVERAVLEPAVESPSAELEPVEVDVNAVGASSTSEARGETSTEISSNSVSVQKFSAGIIAYQKALPRYDLNPPPEYPEISWRRGQQGTVQLEVLVLADGSVGDVDVVVTSGFKKLDRAAQKAVQYWQFKAATAFGKKVDSRVVVPVDFILE